MRVRDPRVALDQVSKLRACFGENLIRIGSISRRTDQYQWHGQPLQSTYQSKLILPRFNIRNVQYKRTADVEFIREKLRIG